MIKPAHAINNRGAPASQRGFTLVEAIVVMVITGILGGVIATFIRLPVQNYVDSAGRAELSDVADTAVRRIAREVRLSLPNSVRVSGASLEFVPTKTGGRYLAAEDDTGGRHLNFADTTVRDFYVVGPLQGGAQQIAVGDNIVINNLGAGYDPGDVYAAASTNRAVVSGVNVGSKLITMANNPFAAQSPPLAHPMHRFLVTNQPVTYRCAGGLLYRHSGYGFNAAQVAAPGGTMVILATNVDSCLFAYDQVANTRTGLVRVTLVLKRAAAANELVRLTQQIHVDNTP